MARAAAGGALYTVGAQAVRALLLIGSTLIAARILSPADYGVIAMAAPVLAFVLLFQDLGLSAATIQAETVSPQQSTTLFWVNIAASALISFLLLAFSPLIAWFYGDERVGYVVAASAGLVLLSSTALQHGALLNREMRFRAIAAIGVAAAGVNFVATILLALVLRSYWALFLGGLAGSIVQVLLTWGVQPWRPSRYSSLRGSGAMLRLGGSLAGFDLLNFLNRNADNVLIGRAWGAGPLGLYDRSYSLMMAPVHIINSPLGRVMLPVLSRLRDEPERYRNSFLISLRALMLVTAPGAAVAIATSEQLVPLLLGPQWRGASPIFFWLAIGTLYQPLGNAAGWLFVSNGRGRALLQWGLVSSVITVGSFIIGLPWGPAGVAMAYVIGATLRLPILLLWAPHQTAVRTRDICWTLLPPLLAAGATWLLVNSIADGLSPVPLILFSLLLSYLLAAAVLSAFPAGREFLGSLFGLVRSAASRRVRRSS